MDPTDCLNCEHSETCKYTQILMCNKSFTPAWMTYKKFPCIYSETIMKTKKRTP